MNHGTLRLLRNILFRIFVLGIVITGLFLWITIAYWPIWVSLASTWFRTTDAVMTPIVIKFFMNVRFLMVYIVLIPALAIHWTLTKEQK